MKKNKKPLFFFSFLLLFTLLSTFIIAGMIDFSQSNFYLAAFWLLGFVLYTLNVSYMLVCSFVSMFFKKHILKEQI